LDPDLVKAAKKDAVDEGIFLREWIERAMRRYLRTPRGER
jgi:hypothetical protein